MVPSSPLERESSTPIGSAAAGRRAGVATTIVVLLLAAACLTPAPAVSAQRVGSITEARVSEGGLNRVTLGPDNKLWFTEGATSSIGRIAPRQLKRSRSPAVDHFPTPTPDSSPIDIVTGPDGNLWFTEFAGNIGRITPSGKVTEFRVPGAPHLFGITAGPDGNLWFIANCCGDPNGMIGRITPGGRVRLFGVRRGTSPSVGITTGPDGRLWYTATNVPCDDPARPCAERIRGTIQRMRPSGRITGVFRIPTPYSDPSRIVTGPDGNLWFTEQGAVGANGCCEPTHPAPGKIGRITPRGHITEFTTPTPFSNPAGITVGPDGNLWFTEYSYRTREGTQQGGNKIGRITTRGVIKEFPLPTPFARADGITFGPDRGVYFTQSPSNNAFGALGRIQTGGRAGRGARPRLPESGRRGCRRRPRERGRDLSGDRRDVVIRHVAEGADPGPIPGGRGPAGPPWPRGSSSPVATAIASRNRPGRYSDDDGPAPGARALHTV